MEQPPARGCRRARRPCCDPPPPRYAGAPAFLPGAHFQEGQKARGDGAPNHEAFSSPFGSICSARYREREMWENAPIPLVRHGMGSLGPGGTIDAVNENQVIAGLAVGLTLGMIGVHLRDAYLR